MDVLGSLADGFATALQPQYLLFAAIGVTLGTLIGVLPGIGPALTVALLLPVTYSLDPTGAFIMFAGIYYGGMYGGSTTSILLNTPGESASIVTTLEGFQMAKRGRGGPALATAAIGSFVAGTISTVAITLFAPAVADVALAFQPADYFALMVLAFVSVSALVGRSLLRGATSLFIGLFIGTIGIDVLTGQSRLTFGVTELLDGLNIVIVAVGLFAVGEALAVASRIRAERGEVLPMKGGIWMSREDFPTIMAGLATWGVHRVSPWRAPGGGRGDPHLPQLQRGEAPFEAPRRIRDRCHRGRGGPRGRQQRGLLGGPGPAADPRHPDLGDGGGHARRVPDLRPAAGPAAVHEVSRSLSGRSSPACTSATPCSCCSTCRSFGSG